MPSPVSLQHGEKKGHAWIRNKSQTQLQSSQVKSSQSQSWWNSELRNPLINYPLSPTEEDAQVLSSFPSPNLVTQVHMLNWFTRNILFRPRPARPHYSLSSLVACRYAPNGTPGWFAHQTTTQNDALEAPLALGWTPERPRARRTKAGASNSPSRRGEARFAPDR